MAVDVVGRGDELGSLHAFLDRARVEGPAALALEGAAGIGKSTLWRAAVESARERGSRVLSCRPAERERGFAHAGLGDLLEGVLEEALPALTAPRRHALEVALYVEDPDGREVDAQALGVAVRSVLQLLSEQQALVVAIDDLQWLDGATAGALGFALRRLPDADVLLLWTRRLGDGEPTPPLEGALDPARIERVRVGPLSIGAIQRIVQQRLSRTIARPTLLRVHEASGGNPFYALEIARALGAGGASRDPTQPLPIPDRLEELVSARLDRFTGATREGLVLAAADPRLTPARLADAGIDRAALEPALDDHVIELVGGTVRFTHPLLASVLYGGLSRAERRRAHRRVAELVDDPVSRARHLALSTDRPDAALAAALEDAAASTAAQRAAGVAAELAEHALRLTPPGDDAGAQRRRAAAVRAHVAAGEVERARVLADELLAQAAGADRGEALALVAEIESGDPLRAIRLMNEALLEPDAAPALRASIHRRLSLVIRFTEGLAVAERHARASVELAEGLGDPALRGAGLAALAAIRFNAGKRGALRLAEQAYELTAATPLSRAAGSAAFALAHVLFWSGRFDRAYSVLEQHYRDWSERDERTAAEALWYLALVELRRGHLSEADEHAERSRELTAPYARADGETPQTFFPGALVALHRGDLDRAGELADEICRLAELHGSRVSVPFALRAVVRLWRGDPEGAVDGFARAEAIEGAPDRYEPGMCWWRAEQIEALLELGRLDDAVTRLDAWEADARRLGSGWALAHATRCRGLVAAARGDVEAATTTLAEAVSRHGAAGDPFGRARALLALGVVRRRGRQKRAAREALEAARDGFEEMGAARWAETARAEIGRVGGRVREDGLSAAERRVADLVAKGRTNAEVAAALFLSQRTVESHLTHVYAKLGVRSRTELAGRLR